MPGLYCILSVLCSLTFAKGFSVTPSLSAALHPELQNAVSKGLLVQPKGRPNVFLLGTVHIGSQSAREAQVLIETVQPKTVVLEMPPSRQRRIRRQKQSSRVSKDDEIQMSVPLDQVQSNSSAKAQNSVLKAIQAIPSLAMSGYQNGGFSGLIFTTFIVGGSLMKQAMSSKEENYKLTRQNEFLAAMDTVDTINVNRAESGDEIIHVLAADLEFEEIIDSIVKSMSILKWIELGAHIFEESIGIKEVDPVRRRPNESFAEWEQRRRDVMTARASREHGENVAGGELGSVLVNKRDDNFVSVCKNALTEGKEDMDTLVCVVGLVHLDGLCKGLAKYT